jgi:hypothetical protein
MQNQIQQNFPQVGPQALPQPSQQPGIQPATQPDAQAGGQQTGTVIVIISPLTVAESGAMWRVGNGPWKKSGETIPDLPLGIYTIEFQDVGNWIKPENQNVLIEGGQTTTLDGIYNSK